VLMINLIGLSLIAAIAFFIFSDKGANSSSMSITPSFPINTPIFPPEPSSIYTGPATLVVFISTESKFWAVTGKQKQKAELR